MRHVLTLFDDRVGWVALALVLVGAVVAVSTRRRTGRAGWVFAAWTSGVLIVSVTLVNRGVLRSDDGWSSDLTWWARHWSDLPAAVTSDLGLVANTAGAAPGVMAVSSLRWARSVP